MAEPLRSLPFTYDEYLLLPEDGPRYELIEGELLMTSAPLMGHQRLSSRLNVRIGSFVEREGLGEVFAAPTDVYLSPTNVVQPDLFYVAKEREYLFSMGMRERRFRGAVQAVLCRIPLAKSVVNS